jgi:hypothetical protein
MVERQSAGLVGNRYPGGLPPSSAPAGDPVGWTTRHVLAAWGTLLAIVTAALHIPGHVSYDSTIQLLEAAQGKSSSWHPPFMSAMLQVLGGGVRATTAFVLLCTAMTYAGLALAAPSLPMRDHPLKTGLAALVMANPVLLLYNGIVWKDVLLAALLCLACGASMAATTANRRGLRWGSAAIAAACLIVAAHTRQQGLLFLPLALLPLLAASSDGPPGRGQWLTWIATVLAAFLLLGHWTGTRIQHVAGWDRERGLQRILAFDIVGTLAMSRDPAAARHAQPLGGIEALRRAYHPSRIDTIRQEPGVALHFDNVRTSTLRKEWRATVGGHPSAYLQHRGAVASHVLGMQNLQRCLPLHVGISGPAEALATVGLSPGVGTRAQWLYDRAGLLYGTPFFRHWFTASVLLVFVGFGARIRNTQPGRIIFWFSLAATLYVLVTTVFAIACDFRYLYPAVSVASACAIALLFQRPAGGHAPPARWLARGSP